MREQKLGTQSPPGGADPGHAKSPPNMADFGALLCLYGVGLAVLLEVVVKLSFSEPGFFDSVSLSELALDE